MSKKPQSYKKGEVSGPPDGQGFVWLTAELLRSPAYRALSLHGRWLIDFLMVEYLQHAGLENGNLMAPYEQLVDRGIPRRAISATIREAEALGLIVVERGGKRNHVENHESRYRLTWLESQVQDAAKPYWARGTDEWRRVTEAKAEAIQAELKDELRAARDGRKARQKLASRFPRGELARFPRGELGQYPTREPSATETQPDQCFGQVPHAGTPSKILAPIGTVQQSPANDDMAEAEQGDIERYLARHRPENADELRQDLKAHLETAPRGTLSRIAEAAGMTASRLSHFKSGGALSDEAAEALTRALQEARAALTRGPRPQPASRRPSPRSNLFSPAGAVCW